MSFSKSLSDNLQLTKQLEKLKLQIDNAIENRELQKCSAKLNKISEKAAYIVDKSDNIKIMQLIRSTQALIHLKKKKIKISIINKLNQGTYQTHQPLQQRTLQYSRSMQNFDPAKLTSPKQLKSNTEIQNWNDRTSIQVNHKNNNKQLQLRIEQLEQQLQRHKKKVNRNEQSRKIDILSDLNSKLTTHQSLFDQQMSIKLRQKNIQIDQLKDKLKRLEQKYQQLKNRLFNEQKRQEDYKKSLKSQITTLTFQLQMSMKQNKKNQQQLNKTYHICDEYKLEIKRLLDETEFLHREKKQMHNRQIMRMKDNTIKKQLQTMSLQDKYMREMQSLLNAEKDQKNILLQKIQQLQKIINNNEHQYRSLNAQKQNIEELLQIKNEEISQLKKHLIETIEWKKQYDLQIQDANRKIEELQLIINETKQQKSLDYRKKAQNLRQIKQILSNN